MKEILNYRQDSAWEAVAEVAQKYPDYIAYEYLGRSTTYQKLIEKTKLCAKSLYALGARRSDIITVCLPNCPQSVILFYAANLLGAAVSIIHPLSSKNEISEYINTSKSSIIFTLSEIYDKFYPLYKSGKLKHIVTTDILDEIISLRPSFKDIITWKSFLNLGKKENTKAFSYSNAHETAAVLYSGGTTGKTKGVLITSYNFNALAMQVAAVNPQFEKGDTMLAALPIFHGFVIGVCIHSVLANGGRCILVPRFNAKTYLKLLKKYKCNYIVGVPTLFEALLQRKVSKRSDLSFIKGVFCGGDTLPQTTKSNFNLFLKSHNSLAKIRQGYGTTECLAASCIMPNDDNKNESVGLPLPDTKYKIVKPNTQIELPLGSIGEICISGPTVMKGYLNPNKNESNPLRKHKDNFLWLHTGDLGHIDEKGFVYFYQRLKRIIVSSGYNIYPCEIEKVINLHELVKTSCVVGIKDSYKMEKVKAFITLKSEIKPSEKTKKVIYEYCKQNIARYALPNEIEFLKALPTTKTGKINFRQLERGNAAVDI